jgi:CheY-like chemotaxis protein
MDSRLTILIIDDDPNDVLLLRKALVRAGVHDPVQVVADGYEAIQYLAGEGEYGNRERYPFPSVVFTDLKMPRMNGFEVLHWLRKHPDCSVIPVMVLSASKQDEDVKKAYQLGANAYLAKPSTLKELEEIVRTAYSFWAHCEKPHLSSTRCFAQAVEELAP